MNTPVSSGISVLKKFAPTIIIPLLMIVLSPATVFAASDGGGFSVEGLNYTADLRNDGSAVITEEWIVAFDDNGADGFNRVINMGSDNFDHISGVTDLSASIDGVKCSESSSESSREGTFSIVSDDDSYSVNWYVRSQNTTHVFLLRYIEKGAVKLYGGKAYYYTTVFDKNSTVLCRDVKMTVTTPKVCFPEDMQILESGSLAGEKSEGKIIFSSANSRGMIHTAVVLPPSVFESSALTLIVDDYSNVITASEIFGIILVIFIVLLAFYIANYRTTTRKMWENNCRKHAHEEHSYESQSEVFNSFSPARVIKITLPKLVNHSDFFIVTVLDLVYRGYLTENESGFSGTFYAKDDPYKRPLSNAEKDIIKMFRKNEFEKLLSDSTAFYSYVRNFNRRIKFVSPFAVFAPSYRKLLQKCFEIKFASEEHEFICPEEISDDFFGIKKYGVFDLTVSVIKEYYLLLDFDFEKENTDRFKKNLFSFRNIYTNGKRRSERFERLMKSRKKGGRKK